MKIKINEKGQALIMVVFFAAIAMLMILALLYMVLRGTSMSSVQKRYQTALDAGYAGVGTTTAFLDSGIFYNIPSSTSNPVYTPAGAVATGATITFPSTGTLQIESTAGNCFFDKLFNAYDITVGNWPGGHCLNTNPNNDTSIDPTVRPDIEYAVSGANANYYVYAKITDSHRGLVAQRPPGGLEIARGFANKTQAPGLTITPQAYFYYTVEVQAQNNSSTKETANISFDYAY